MNLFKDLNNKIEKVNHSYVDTKNGRYLFPHPGFGILPTFPMPIFIAKKPYAIPTLQILTQRKVFSLVFDVTQEDLEKVINDDDVCFNHGLKKYGGKCWSGCKKKHHILEWYKKNYVDRIQNLPIPCFIKGKFGSIF